MSSFEVTKKTTFSEVYDKFSAHQSRKKDDQDSLRLSGTSLHTKSGTPSGWGKKAKTERGQKK